MGAPSPLCLLTVQPQGLDSKSDSTMGWPRDHSHYSASQSHSFFREWPSRTRSGAWMSSHGPSLAECARAVVTATTNVGGPHRETAPGSADLLLFVPVAP